MRFIIGAPALFIFRSGWRSRATTELPAVTLKTLTGLKLLVLLGLELRISGKSFSHMLPLIFWEYFLIFFARFRSGAYMPTHPPTPGVGLGVWVFVRFSPFNGSVKPQRAGKGY